MIYTYISRAITIWSRESVFSIYCVHWLRLDGCSQVIWMNDILESQFNYYTQFLDIALNLNVWLKVTSVLKILKIFCEWLPLAWTHWYLVCTDMFAVPCLKKISQDSYIASFSSVKRDKNDQLTIWHTGHLTMCSSMYKWSGATGRK